MKSTKATHQPRAIDPMEFRAQATGIGQSLEASKMTGLARAQRVANTIPMKCRAAVPAAEGYPMPREVYKEQMPQPMHPWNGEAEEAAEEAKEEHSSMVFPTIYQGRIY